MEHIVLDSSDNDGDGKSAALPSVEFADPKKFPAKYKPLAWGQLKLLIHEVSFFSKATQSFPDAKRAVYAGAAPGTSMKYVASLFPTVTFILYDPADFDPILERVANIVLKRECFTVQKARAYTGCIFMSDIRSGESEDEICSDMSLQLRCSRAMGCAMSSFKFRLPFTSGSTLYPEGSICLQAFAPVSSTELRLEVEGADADSVIEYDHSAAEGRMAHYNQVLRLSDLSGTEIKLANASVSLADVFKGHLDLISNDAFLFAQAALCVSRIKNTGRTLQEFRSVIDEMWAAAAGAGAGAGTGAGAPKKRIQDYLKLR